MDSIFSCLFVHISRQPLQKDRNERKELQILPGTSLILEQEQLGVPHSTKLGKPVSQLIFANS